MIVNFYTITWFNNKFCGSIYWAVSRFVVPLYFNPKKIDADTRTYKKLRSGLE